MDSGGVQQLTWYPMLEKTLNMKCPLFTLNIYWQTKGNNQKPQGTKQELRGNVRTGQHTNQQSEGQKLSGEKGKGQETDKDRKWRIKLDTQSYD